MGPRYTRSCRPKLDDVRAQPLVESLQSPGLPLDSLRRQRPLVGQRRPPLRAGGQHVCEGTGHIEVAWLRGCGAIAGLLGSTDRCPVVFPASAVVGILRRPRAARPSKRARVAVNVALDAAGSEQRERGLLAQATGRL